MALFSLETPKFWAALSKKQKKKKKKNGEVLGHGFSDGLQWISSNPLTS